MLGASVVARVVASKARRMLKSNRNVILVDMATAKLTGKRYCTGTSRMKDIRSVRCTCLVHAAFRRKHASPQFQLTLLCSSPGSDQSNGDQQRAEDTGQSHGEKDLTEYRERSFTLGKKAREWSCELAFK